jgi:hypothetical protein
MVTEAMVAVLVGLRAGVKDGMGVNAGSAIVDPAWPVSGVAFIEGTAAGTQAPHTINTASGRETLMDK